MRQKLTGVELYELQAALRMLDGAAADDKDQKEKYFFSGPTLYALARNLRETTNTLAALEDTRQSIAKQVGAACENPTPPARLAFESEWTKVLRAYYEVDLAQIKVSELRLGFKPDENRIPINMVAAMDSILLPD